MQPKANGAHEKAPHVSLAHCRASIISSLSFLDVHFAFSLCAFHVLYPLLNHLMRVLSRHPHVTVSSCRCTPNFSFLILETLCSTCPRSPTVGASKPPPFLQTSRAGKCCASANTARGLQAGYLVTTRNTRQEIETSRGGVLRMWVQVAHAPLIR